MSASVGLHASYPSVICIAVPAPLCACLQAIDCYCSASVRGLYSPTRGFLQQQTNMTGKR